jgi:twinkle protein
LKTFFDYGIDTKGKASGEVKAICPRCSPHRKKRNYPCLNVNIDKGVWHCWHCDWSGGIKQGEIQPARIAKQYRRPDYIAVVEAIPDDIGAWFQKRGITADVLKRNQVAKGVRYFPQVESEKPCVLFPYLRGTEVINIKSRTRDKLFRMESGCERVLYGLNDISETLIWVEGEIDKLSLEVAGYTSCVSVPDGAPAPESKSYATKFDWLDAPELGRVQHHVIAVDSDAAGKRLEAELCRRLGKENCSVVTWPDGCKDANDVLVTLGVDTLIDCIKEAQPVPLEGAYEASDFAESLLNRYRNGAERGLSTGWPSLDEFYTVMPGEWTLVTGIPGHGKSELLDALTINLARNQGWPFAVFSPENQPIEYHIQKLAEKFIGKPMDRGPTERMNEADLDMAVTWLKARYTFLLPEEPTLEALLDMARHLVKSKGIRGFVLDPWNEIDHMRPKDLSETEYISKCLTNLRRFARSNDVHVWVVAHPTKLLKDKDGKYPCPTPYDVAGSAHWRNKADNCLAIWRDPTSTGHEVEIHVQKVRKKVNGRVGMATLRYNLATGQYSEPHRDNRGRPVEYSFAEPA